MTGTSGLSLQKKTTLGNLQQDSAMGDLLKITEKVGVSSTRHVGDDYLSKLQ
jgi:hypothetical protein